MIRQIMDKSIEFHLIGQKWRECVGTWERRTEEEESKREKITNNKYQIKDSGLHAWVEIQITHHHRPLIASHIHYVLHFKTSYFEFNSCGIGTLIVNDVIAFVRELFRMKKWKYHKNSKNKENDYFVEPIRRLLVFGVILKTVG